VIAMDYSVEEQKRRKAFEQKRKRQKKVLSGLEAFNIIIGHDGNCWRIDYCSISDSVEDTDTFGIFLEALKERGETIASIISNIGTVKLTATRGVKGFVVITRKTKK
jgi:hypothetical protein